jgi:hypothetical protein
MTKPGKILLVEDDPYDVELTLSALTENHLTNEIVVTRVGRRRWILSVSAGGLSVAGGGKPGGDPARS